MTNALKNDNSKNGGKVIPFPSGIVAPFIQELNITRIEGFYFCFDPKEAKMRVKPLEYTQGDKKIVIEPHPTYGQPSILAYKILQAVFKKITAGGKPFTDTVSFSVRELGKFIGRESFGGKDSIEIFRAIRQLRQTAVYVHNPQKNGKKGRVDDINIFITSSVITDSDESNGSGISEAVFTLHPAIINSLRNDHFVIYNLDYISSLPPLTSVLYKKLFFHFSNLYESKLSKEKLKFEKDYEDICNEWLGGLNAYKYKSDIERQLSEHINILTKWDFLSSFSVEKKADNKGFKLVFKPSDGFFKDYIHFYKNKNPLPLLQVENPDYLNLLEPSELTRYFYKKLLKNEIKEDLINQKDIEFAKTILEKYELTTAKMFVDFSLQSASNTKFDIKTIHALKNYFIPFDNQREILEKSQKAEVIKLEQARNEKLQRDYDFFVKDYYHKKMDTLPSEEQELYKNQAREKIKNQNGMGFGFETLVMIATKTIVLEKYPAPSFEEWKSKLK